MIETKTIRLSKTFVNKFVQWTTSRYNIYKKPQVVNEIMKGMMEGCLWQRKWIDKNELINCQDLSNLDYREIDSCNGKKLIEKPIYNRIYTPGTYCECSAMTHDYDYYVNFRNKELIKCNIDDNGKIIKEYEKVKFIL